MDIILDTNAFGRIFAERAAEQFVEKVVRECDVVHVLKDIWKELRGAYPNLLREYIRKLERGKLREKKVEKRWRMPEDIEDKLRSCGADQFDVNLVKLAFEISRSRGCEARCRVYLVSNDRCIWGVKGLLENYGIHALKLDDFWREYIG
jgi:hypothetical protein